MPKRKKTLSEKLSEVDSFLNIEIFSADDFDQMVHRYIPQFRDLESIKELTEGNDNALKILDAQKYRSFLKKIRVFTNIEGHPLYDKEESERKGIKHHILAIALSQFNKQRLKETENDLASSQREVRDLNRYLAGLPNELASLTLDQLIAFNSDQASAEMAFFPQDLFERSQETGGLKTDRYKEAISRAQAETKQSIDALLIDYNLDALIAPSGGVAWSIDQINGDRSLGGVLHLPSCFRLSSSHTPDGYAPWSTCWDVARCR
jgi:hypothetical protein